MLASCQQQLKAKLQVKGKHRPHAMVKKKWPDGSGALSALPRRGTTPDADAAYCAAVDQCAKVFGRQRRSQSTAAEHKMYMRLFDGWLVRSGFGSYIELDLDKHGMLVAVRARRSAVTNELKIVRPQMLIGWLLEMASGSENTPKGTHPSEIAARAAHEAAAACGKRAHHQRTKGVFGYGPFAAEPWSLQAYQKRVYAVRADHAARRG